MKLQKGHMVAERYIIEEQIGSGGMSVVYRARDTKLDRDVTFKILKEEYLQDENFLERFPKEARAAAGLNHQNIVSVFDHGRDGDIMYIVLEYVDGASLKELITKKAPFDNETNLGVSIQVAEGISEAHRNEIIHLDIKPQNILIALNSIVKVTDFGIARVARNATINAASGSMGSVHYFSPEQARGGFIDEKSDIYSLGIVMFEMATGKLPFEADNELTVAYKHINNPLPEILELNPNVSDSIVKIIQKATEKSASKRYQNMDDMIDDLKRALTDESGAFVELEEDVYGLPTRVISRENQEAVRRQKMRAAFLDGEEIPEDEEENNFKEDEYDDYSRFANAPKPEPTQREKDSDRIAVYGGIIFGLIFALIIGIVTYHINKNVLSPTAGMVETPDIIGLSWFEAEEKIRDAGLEPFREDDMFCDGEDCELDDCEGLVFIQRAVGRLLSPGDLVRYVVSAGKSSEGANMPVLINESLDNAREILQNLNLDLIIVENFFENEDLPENILLETEPPAYEIIKRGDTITLTITSAPEKPGMIRVPFLVGLTQEAATALLLENSLVLGEISRIEHDYIIEGQIVRHDPLPGTTAEENSVVALVISSG
ncbi:MAG: Stk1 family PASTA domain-containing Ser/Thr kinase, partial [Defluviitaleaceae bacterium]|nr:Stk1 family PASTA domain-containing Ser/Thr kinase [Defluviitaleaceae bacterium]